MHKAAWFVSACVAATFCVGVRAECSNTVQCIGISANSAAEAEHNHHGGAGGGGTTPGSTAVTMDFGNQPVAGAIVKTLYVAAAQGPEGAVVTLEPIRITGANANQFSLTGGSCALNGGNGPTHRANQTGHCTIEVRFSPTSPGAKTAQLTVPFQQPIAGFIDHRDATLSGVGGNDRISPALDPGVASLIAAQVDAQRRFAAAQVSNISSRLDSLHRAGGQPVAGRGFSAGLPDRRGAVVVTARNGAGEPPWMRDPHSGRDEAPGGVSAELEPLPNMLVSLLTTRQVPVMLASDAGARGASDGGYWFGGVASFGRVGPSGNETRFETTGFTLGADRRVAPGLVVGAAAGYGRAANTFGANGSDSRNTGQSLSLYGSYELLPDVHLDAILGYGKFDSRSNRYVVLNQSMATSERDGSQIFGSLAISKQLREEKFSWAPYARLEFNRGTLDRASETGAGIRSLTYLEHKHRSSRLSLGIRASAVHEMEFGRVVPHLRLEHGRDLQRTDAANVAYADQPAGPSYSVAPIKERRGHSLIGVGAEFLTRRGISLGFDIATNGRFSKDPEYTTRFWLASALGDGLSRPSGQAPVSSKTPFNLTAGLRLDNNITRTGSPTPTLSDRIWSVGIGIDDRVEFSESLNLALGAQATAEKYQHFDRLDAAVLAVRAELAYQAGGLFTSPRFGAFANAAYDDSRSDLRTGHRIELGVNTRVQVAERTGISAVLAHHRRRARGDIYDTDSNAARIGADHRLGERGTLLAGLELRRGDFVSSGIPAADSASISEALADDDAFPQKRFVAYRFPADSLIATIGYNLSLGRRDSFRIGFSAIRVRPTNDSDYNRFVYPFRLNRGQGGKSPYSVRQFDIAYTMLF